MTTGQRESGSRALAISSERLPRAADARTVLLTCEMLVHTWAIIAYLHELPSLVLRMTLWEMVGALSYTLTFAFVESLLMAVVILALSVLLPARWLRDRLARRGPFLSLSLMLLGWALGGSIASGSYVGLVPGVILLVSIGMALVGLEQRSSGVRRTIDRLISGLQLLGGVYLALDGVGLGIVVIRNL